MTNEEQKQDTPEGAQSEELSSTELLAKDLPYDEERARIIRNVVQQSKDADRRCLPRLVLWTWQGCGYLEGYGYHPGSGFVAFLIALGAAAGAAGVLFIDYPVNCCSLV